MFLRLAWIVSVAIGTAWVPAAAADYGPARDVRDVRSTLQRESSALTDHSPVHDVTAAGDYAIVGRGEAPVAYQTLLVRRKGAWGYHASSGGDGFVTAELLAYGVPRLIAARLTAHDRGARNAAQPLSPEVRCIHTEVSSVETYFPNDRRSGAAVRFFGRIYDPYQGTLSPELIQRGYSPLMQMRRGDRVQVCLVYVPTIEPTSRCRPARDPRGRWYRAFDYRLRRAFTAPNANHGCGGA